MADLIRNLVEETANNPGTGLTVVLGGAVTNRMSFVQLFGDGVQAAYVLTDGVQSEWGVGKVTAGSPTSLSRDTVLGNTAGTTARLNFTGAVRVSRATDTGEAPTEDQTRAWVFGDAEDAAERDLAEEGAWRPCPDGVGEDWTVDGKGKFKPPGYLTGDA